MYWVWSYFSTTFWFWKAGCKVQVPVPYRTSSNSKGSCLVSNTKRRPCMGTQTLFLMLRKIKIVLLLRKIIAYPFAKRCCASIQCLLLLLVVVLLRQSPFVFPKYNIAAFEKNYQFSNLLDLFVATWLNEILCLDHQQVLVTLLLLCFENRLVILLLKLMFQISSTAYCCQGEIDQCRTSTACRCYIKSREHCRWWLQPNSILVLMRCGKLMFKNYYFCCCWQMQTLENIFVSF